MARPSPLSRPGPAVHLGLGANTLVLGDMTDLDLTGLADGDIIIWDDATDTWIVGPPSGSSLDVTDGTTTVSPTTTLDFDPTYFDVTAPGGDVAEVTFIGGGGGVIVEDEGTPLATTATTLDFVGAGVVASGAGATKTITISGGGGGGLTQAYEGYNTAGASWDVAGINAKLYMKQVTLANDCLVASIDSYIQHAAGDAAGPAVALYEDSGGSPAKVVGIGAGPTKVQFAATTPRWIATPLGMWVPAGTYWIAIRTTDSIGVSVVLQVAYDGSGSDKTAAGLSDRWSDGANLTFTTTSNKFSIRANTVR